MSHMSTLRLTVLLAASAMSQAHPPESAADGDDFAARLEQAIETRNQLGAFDLDVEVRAGTAVLRGCVDDPVERERAERQAATAAGIDRVESLLRVAARNAPPQRHSTVCHGCGCRSDARITADVRSRLRWNPAVDARDLQVDSEQGRVVLRGAVSDAVERATAVRLTMLVPGVVAVDDRLQFARADAGRSDPAPALKDVWIAAQVRAALLVAEQLDGFDLSVQARRGVVVLGGVAQSPAARQRAIEIARGVAGVRAVNADALVIAA